MIIFQITVLLVKRAIFATQKVWRLQNLAKMVQSASRQDYPNVKYVQAVPFAHTQVKGQIFIHIFSPSFNSITDVPVDSSHLESA